MASQGKNQISVSIPGEKNSQEVLETLGNTGPAPLPTRPLLRARLQRGQGQDPLTGPAAHLRGRVGR